jgi:tetratricopeptide (TPR) repeat protein
VYNFGIRPNGQELHMGQVEKTVFISYRRTNLPWALNIYQYLMHHNYDVFFDYESINSGDFEQVLIGNIKARAHFVLVLTPSALERCINPDDWLRREIETALDEKRNIIPLFLENFNFGSPSISKLLTGKLEKLKSYNGLNVHVDYFEEAMQRLCTRFLDVPLEAIIHPIPNAVQEIIEGQKDAANRAAQVKQEELSAQEWFEKGYVFQEANRLDEAIRGYSEALRHQPDLAEAYYNRGVVRRAKGDRNGALEDYNQAIRLQPNLAEYRKSGIELQPVGFFPKLLVWVGSILTIAGFAGFGYVAISFVLLVFNLITSNSSEFPDFSGINFNLIPIGFGLMFIGSIIFMIGGGMSVLRMFTRKSPRK